MYCILRAVRPVCVFCVPCSVLCFLRYVFRVACRVRPVLWDVGCVLCAYCWSSGSMFIVSVLSPISCVISVVALLALLY